MSIKKVQTLQKVFAIIMIVMMLVSTLSTIVMGVEPKNMKGDNTATSAEIVTAGKKIINILQTVGIVLSVIILIIIGIKYMMGSAEEKAEYKKTLMPYIIGAALIFAASVFAQVAYEFFTSLGGKTEA